MIDAVARVKTGICFERKGIPAILTHIDDGGLCLFGAVGQLANKQTVGSAYRSIVENAEKNWFLLPDDKKIIDGFFDALGHSDGEHQRELCDNTAARLLKQLENAEETYKKYGGVFSKSGILAGLFIVIMLL